MKNLLLTALSILFLSTALCQKVKMKGDVAVVDGEPFLNFTTITFGSDYELRHVKGTDNDISILYLDYTDPNESSTGNPDGKVRWIEFNFTTLNIKCEVSSRGKKGVAKLIYLSNIYKEGQLDPDSAQQFCNKYGTKFSDNRPNGNTTIIINN